MHGYTEKIEAVYKGIKIHCVYKYSCILIDLYV